MSCRTVLAANGNQYNVESTNAAIHVIRFDGWISLVGFSKRPSRDYEIQLHCHELAPYSPTGEQSTT
jgi:hypothetical protein